MVEHGPWCLILVCKTCVSIIVGGFMKIGSLSLLPIIGGLMLASALSANAQAPYAKIPVKGASWTVKDSSSQSAVSLQITGWLHPQLGPIDANSQIRTGEWRIGKKIEVDCTLTHTKLYTAFEQYQGIKGNETLPGKAVRPDAWLCDSIDGPGSPVTQIGRVGSGWNTSGEAVALTETWPWQAPHTIYWWDAPGENTDQYAHAPATAPGSLFRHDTFEDIVKYKIGNSYEYVKNSYVTWTQTLDLTEQHGTNPTDAYYYVIVNNK